MVQISVPAESWYEMSEWWLSPFEWTDFFFLPPLGTLPTPILPVWVGSFLLGFDVLGAPYKIVSTEDEEGGNR